MKIPTLECLKCGHIWTPRKANPEVCPKCKSYAWNEPKEDPATKHIMVSELPENHTSNIEEMLKRKLDQR